MDYSLEILRSIAIILITNSHLDDLYPVSAVATGGMLGNSLFFFISGMGIAKGLLSKHVPFTSWIKKRFLRIYEPLFITTLALWAFGYFHFETISILVLNLLFPEHYWFLPVIFLFYFPSYIIIIKLNTIKAFIYIYACAIVMYFVNYFFSVDFSKISIEGRVETKIIYYFIVMLSGVFVEKYPIKGGGRYYDAVSVMLLTALYGICLLVISRWHLFHFQFLIHVCGLFWVIAMYRSVRAGAMADFLQCHFHRVINFLSKNALQIYLLQASFYSMSFVVELSFPGNVLVFWGLLLPAAALLSRVNFASFKRIFLMISVGEAR